MALRIRLSWTDTNSFETGYNVYRSDSPMDPGSLPAPLAFLPANSTEYVDESVVENNTYYYRVSALSPYGEAVSSEVSKTVSFAPAIGSYWTGQGGYYAGLSALGHHVIVAPKSSEVASRKWKNSSTNTPGTGSIESDADYLHAQIVAAGISNHPAAQYCDGYSNGGFTDWVLPGFREMQVIHTNLNPTNSSTPSPFKTGESQAFNPSHPTNYYWTSSTVEAATCRAGRPSSPTYWNYDKQTTTVTTRPIRLVKA